MPSKSDGSKRKFLKRGNATLPNKRKGVAALDESDQAVYKAFSIRSELLEKISQFAPHLVGLLQGPQIDPYPSPLEGRTTDDLIQLLEFGWLPSEVATIWSVDRARLSQWIMSDDKRVAQAKLARKAQAEMWDRIAFAIGLYAPSDRVEMARAKLLMDHCKWRSSMYSPDDYVKRLSVKSTIENKEIRELTNSELQIIANGGKLPGAQ